MGGSESMPNISHSASAYNKADDSDVLGSSIAIQGLAILDLHVKAQLPDLTRALGGRFDPCQEVGLVP
jgi:hypothetical protein